MSDRSYSFRKLIERSALLREFKYRFMGPFHAMRYRKLSPEDQAKSLEAIQAVLDCPDQKLIPRVAGAGKVKGGRQIMHNGVQVLAGSYYGHWIRTMLEQTGGVHEPQEERVFSEVMKFMPPKATMIELGAYWGFYSIWFHKLVAQPTCYLVEPMLSHMNYGKKNFQINSAKGHFTQAFVGGKSGTMENTPMICVDDFVAEHAIEHIDILHVDIQGAEVDMLHGAVRTLARKAIDYIFLSTHSNELHAGCKRFLEEHDFVILASANIDESYALDGVLVARRADKPGLEPVAISLKPAASKPA